MKGWSEVALREVLEDAARLEAPQPGVQYRQLGVRLWGAGAYERESIDGGDTQYAAFNRCETGDMVVNKIWARNGSVSVVQRELAGCFVSTEFPLYRAKPSVIPGWLRLITKARWFWSACDEKARGTSGKNRIKPSTFLEICIPLPPLAEQQRLVAHFDAIESRFNRAQKLREEAEGELAALFPKLLAEAMTPHGDGWKRETVKDVIESMDAGWSPRCHDYPAGIGQWGVLKTTSVQWGDFQRQHNKALPSTYVPVPSLAVQEGDVLVTRAGPRKRVGVVAAVKSSEPWLTISDKLIRLRADRAKIQPRFLELSLASPFSQEHLVQRKTGLADAQVNISQAILRATPIAYPPIQEQEKIVAQLDAARGSTNELSCHQKAVGVELNALLPSLLDRILHP